MPSIIGVDSRIFVRDTIKKDETKGHFESVLGIAVEIRDYIAFGKHYQNAISNAFSAAGVDIDYQYYCTNDLSGVPQKHTILDAFASEICKHIGKVDVFYTLFSKQQLAEVQVYGRLSRKEHLKLATATRTYEDLLSKHLIQCFPAICAWKLSEYFSPRNVQFHLDSYEGHICEAQEILEKRGFTRFVFPNGDCVDPVISTADLLLGLLDKRLETQGKFLLFDNIRPALPEFGENVLVYPISNKHLPRITPLDKIPIDTMRVIKHPVFWVFKGEAIIDSETMKKSKAYRNLLDYVASQYGVVKMFDNNRDAKYLQNGDYGVYLNSKGKEIIESYRMLGKPLKPFKFDYMVPNDLKPIRDYDV